MSSPRVEDVTCTGCGSVIDPDTCSCGEPIAPNIVHDNHYPVPAGCKCFYDMGDGLGIDRTNL
jgi:hypothetical protein